MRSSGRVSPDANLKLRSTTSPWVTAGRACSWVSASTQASAANVNIDQSSPSPSSAARFLPSERRQYALDRRQPRWPRTMAHGALHRDVWQLLPAADASQQQAAAAHVAPANEIAGKQQAIAEDLQKHVDVLGRRDTAEQDDVALRSDFLRQ